MLNADCTVSKFGEVRLDEPSFVRPIHDTKCFAGTVFDKCGFEYWQRQVCDMGSGGDLSEDTLVLVAPVVPIQVEYRCWVVKGHVVTYSTYKLGDKVVYNEGVDLRIKEFAEDRAEE